MKNKTSELLENYIKKNLLNIPEGELKFLLTYLFLIKKENIENSQETDYKALLDDLSHLNSVLKNGDLTTISYDRLRREIELFDSILNGEDLDEVSYKLDKLYLECDLGIRAKSTLVNRLLLKNNKKVKK